MILIENITNKTIALVGGLVATGAAVVAEAVSTDNAVGTGSFLLGGAGLIAAISAFTKDYWSDRQKQRDHEVSVLRLKLRSCRACSAVHELYAWAKAVHEAVPALPPVPEVRFDEPAEGAGDDHHG
jgi:hypothetical protein